jgi:hypothetical protein
MIFRAGSRWSAMWLTLIPAYFVWTLESATSLRTRVALLAATLIIGTLIVAAFAKARGHSGDGAGSHR